MLFIKFYFGPTIILNIIYSFIHTKITEYNESQKEVIIEASAIITSKDAKFYFVQGPPGIQLRKYFNFNIFSMLNL
jgi:hypothetical protein